MNSGTFAVLISCVLLGGCAGSSTPRELDYGPLTRGELRAVLPTLAEALINLPAVETYPDVPTIRLLMPRNRLLSELADAQDFMLDLQETLQQHSKGRITYVGPNYAGPCDFRLRTILQSDRQQNVLLVFELLDDEGRILLRRDFTLSRG